MDSIKCYSCAESKTRLDGSLDRNHCQGSNPCNGYRDYRPREEEPTIEERLKTLEEQSRINNKAVMGLLEHMNLVIEILARMQEITKKEEKREPAIPIGEFCYRMGITGVFFCPYSNKSQAGLTGNCIKYGVITGWNGNNGSGCNFKKCSQCLEDNPNG